GSPEVQLDPTVMEEEPTPYSIAKEPERASCPRQQNFNLFHLSTLVKSFLLLPEWEKHPKLVCFLNISPKQSVSRGFYFLEASGSLPYLIK
ncbi:hypothetical protein, partial [Aquifex sp.]